jgi:mannose-6-phosphate isomerase-like protein (cupin superfamily)
MTIPLPEQHHEERPWGNFTEFVHNAPCTVKIITVAPGEAFSLQFHHHRAEFWRIIEGSGKITLGEHSSETKLGNEYHIPAGMTHRMEGGPNGVSFLEIAFGEFDEKDIVRLEDRYGRT